MLVEVRLARAVSVQVSEPPKILPVMPIHPSPSVVTASTRQWADRLGIWTSALCVVHCVMTPVLLSFSAVLAHFLPGEEGTHRFLALFVGLFGAVALVSGFRRHRRVPILLVMTFGLVCIAGAAFFGSLLPSHAYEVVITFVGSAAMITAHRLNHTFCSSCECSTHK